MHTLIILIRALVGICKSHNAVQRMKTAGLEFSANTSDPFSEIAKGKIGSILAMAHLLSVNGLPDCSEAGERIEHQDVRLLISSTALLFFDSKRSYVIINFSDFINVRADVIDGSTLIIKTKSHTVKCSTSYYFGAHPLNNLIHKFLNGGKSNILEY